MHWRMSGLIDARLWQYTGFVDLAIFGVTRM